MPYSKHIATLTISDPDVLAKAKEETGYDFDELVVEASLLFWPGNPARYTVPPHKGVPEPDTYELRCVTHTPNTCADGTVEPTLPEDFFFSSDVVDATYAAAEDWLDDEM